MQRGSFSPLFLPRAQKIRSRARLRPRDLIALKGEKPGKTPEVAYLFFRPAAGRPFRAGWCIPEMAKSGSDFQKQGAKSTLTP